MLVSSLYNLADTFFVGKLGTDATAAVGVLFPFYNIINAILNIEVFILDGRLEPGSKLKITPASCLPTNNRRAR